MNTFAKLAIAAAAVLVVAVVGINLLSAVGGPGVGGPGVSPSSSPAARPSPSHTPEFAFPPEGELSVGRHSIRLDGVPLSFEVPTSGWFSNPSATGDWIQQGPDNATTPVWMIFWSVDNVYADPCGHVQVSPPVGPSAADLAAAVSTMPGTDLVTGPTEVTVGGRPAQHVVITVREDIACHPEDFYLWIENGKGSRYASREGFTIKVWIVEVDGERIFIESERLVEGPAPELDQQIDQIVDSIEFEGP